MNFTADMLDSITFFVGFAIQSFFWITLWYVSTQFSLWKKEYKPQSLRNVYKKFSFFLEIFLGVLLIPFVLFILSSSSIWKLEFPYQISESISLFFYGLMVSCIFWLFEFVTQTTFIRARKLASIYVIPLCAVLLIVSFQLMPRSFSFFQTSLLVTLPLTLNCILVYSIMKIELQGVHKEKTVKLQLRLRGKRVRRDILLFYIYFVFVIPALYLFFNSSSTFMIWWAYDTILTLFFLFLATQSFMSALVVYMTFFTYAFTKFYPWLEPILVIPLLLIFADMIRGIEYIYTPLPKKNRKT